MSDYMKKIKNIQNAKIIPKSRLCMSKNVRTNMMEPNPKKLELLNTKGKSGMSLGF